MIKNMTCNSRCWYARGDKCNCSCNGANHGSKINEVDEQIDIILTEEEAMSFKNRCIVKKCFCGYKKLLERPIYGYKHDGGFEVRDNKYWLYIHCPKCKNDINILKLRLLI